MLFFLAMAVSSPAMGTSCYEELHNSLMALQAESEKLDGLKDVFLEFNEVEGMVRDSTLDFKILLRPGKQAIMTMQGQARTFKKATKSTQKLYARLRRLKLGNPEDHMSTFEKNYKLFYIDYLNFFAGLILSGKTQEIPVKQAMKIYQENEEKLKKLEDREEYICGSLRIYKSFNAAYDRYVSAFDALFRDLLANKCKKDIKDQFFREISRDGKRVEAIRKIILTQNPYLADYGRCNRL